MKKTITPGGVDKYISSCPKDVREKLAELRQIIRKVAPTAIETVSYFQIPGYSYEGYNYNGMFAWFSYKGPYIRLHVIPPAIKNHKKELENYQTTNAIVSFTQESKIPVALVKKLVKESIKLMKKKSKL